MTGIFVLVIIITVVLGATFCIGLKQNLWTKFAVYVFAGVILCGVIASALSILQILF